MSRRFFLTFIYLGKALWKVASLFQEGPDHSHKVTHIHQLEAAQHNHILICWPLLLRNFTGAGFRVKGCAQGGEVLFIHFSYPHNSVSETEAATIGQTSSSSVFRPPLPHLYRHGQWTAYDIVGL